jgi:hypothetical protein
MAKRNLTIQLEDNIIRRAKVVAAKRGTSVSGLVARQLQDVIEHDERYEAARLHVLDAIRTATDRGGRTSTRDELYDRPVMKGG